MDAPKNHLLAPLATNHLLGNSMNQLNSQQMNSYSNNQLQAHSTNHLAQGISSNNLGGSGLVTASQTGSTQKMASSSSANGNIVGVHYKVGKKIGEGSFGVLYEGLNLLNNQLVAIKFEPRKCEAPQLRDEFRTYKILRNTG